MGEPAGYATWLDSVRVNLTIQDFTTVDAFVNLIKHQSNDFFGFRSRHAKFTSRLQRYLQPVTVLEDLLRMQMTP